MQRPLREGIIKQKPPHHWRKQNQLLWKSWYTYSQSSAHQNHAKQRYLHPRRQIHDHRHLKYISQYSHDTLQISQTKYMWHPRRNHTTVQPTREGSTRPQHIRGNPKRHVRPTPSRTHQKQATRKMIIKTQIHPNQDSARNLDTKMETHPIHPSRRQFWGKIHWKIECSTPNFYPPIILHSHTWLGGKTLC